MTWATLLLSAFCCCTLCTKKHHPDCRTRSGFRAEANVTVACDPKHLGDLVYIDTIGLRFCDDTGSAIKGNRVDIYFENHEEAKKFGRKRRRGVFIDPKRNLLQRKAIR